MGLLLMLTIMQSKLKSMRYGRLVFLSSSEETMLSHKC